jgi:hypothetical protein
VTRRSRKVSWLKGFASGLRCADIDIGMVLAGRFEARVAQDLEMMSISNLARVTPD